MTLLKSERRVYIDFMFLGAEMLGGLGKYTSVEDNPVRATSEKVPQENQAWFLDFQIDPDVGLCSIHGFGSRG